MKNTLTCAALSLMALGSGPAPAQDLPAAQPAVSTAVTPASAYPVTPAPGLYQALGEQAGIRALMDDFVRRLAADARIGNQFREINLTNLASQLSSQVCQLSGGPCIYQGPSMKEAHASMDVTRGHFNALVEVLQQSLDARGLPFTRQNQLLALLAPMHRDVINTR
jgi:hemoglobin